MPKAPGTFSYAFHWDEGVWDSGITWDESPANAVIRHELNQAGFPTAGVSTTPSVWRARHYALAGGQRLRGVIYVIDAVKLETVGVKKFRVADYATAPSVPIDEEVILVADDGGEIPAAVVSGVIPITPFSFSTLLLFVRDLWSRFF